MAFQAHLVMTIRERGITRATRVPWEVTERLRDEGHKAYVTSVNNIGPRSQTPPPEKGGRVPEKKGRGCAILANQASTEIREAIAEPIAGIVEVVKMTLERTPLELAADIVDRGNIMAGGGSLLRGLDRLLAEETGMPVTLADDPLGSVVLGTGRVLEELETLKKVLITSKKS